MNFIPKVEILKIGDKRYRVYALSENSLDTND